VVEELLPHAPVGGGTTAAAGRVTVLQLVVIEDRGAADF
jgi:hypothetical protein